MQGPYLTSLRIGACYFFACPQPTVSSSPTPLPIFEHFLAICSLASLIKSVLGVHFKAVLFILVSSSFVEFPAHVTKLLLKVKLNLIYTFHLFPPVLL